MFYVLQQVRLSCETEGLSSVESSGRSGPSGSGT